MRAPIWREEAPVATPSILGCGAALVGDRSWGQTGARGRPHLADKAAWRANQTVGQMGNMTLAREPCLI